MRRDRGMPGPKVEAAGRLNQNTEITAGEPGPQGRGRSGREHRRINVLGPNVEAAQRSACRIWTKEGTHNVSAVQNLE